VINFFVIIRMRQAYETYGYYHMSAEEWNDAGRPASNKTVFGVTDLSLKAISENPDEGKMILDAEYILWLPDSQFKDDDEIFNAENIENIEDIKMLPGGLVTRDRLVLTLHKDAWRITEINRVSQEVLRN